MEENLVHEDETLEDLQLGGLQLIQKKNGFRFGMDSVLLAHFAFIRENDTVADFGTGSGVLPLLLIGRNKGKTFRCFEIQEELTEMARRTMVLNGMENRVEIIQGDAADAEQWIAACSLDAVICNPPYSVPGKSISSPMETRAISRSQQKDTIKSFFKSAFRVLKGRGSLFLVYPAPQMLEVMKQLQEAHLEPKRFQLVYPYADKPANLVLIEAVKDAKPMLHPMDPLIIYENNRNLTNRLKSVYHINQNPV